MSIITFTASKERAKTAAYGCILTVKRRTAAAPSDNDIFVLLFTQKPDAQFCKARATAPAAIIPITTAKYAAFK